MIRKSVTFRSLSLAACAITIAANITSVQATAMPNKIKNIIVLVPDGCDATVQTVARWYKGAPLAVDSLVRGAVKTWMSNSIIPGSAAAATAFATGFKSTEPFIGVGPRTSDAISTYEFPFPADVLAYRPLATVLETAKKIGKSTGLVATSRVTHATPAAFAAHINSRDDEQGIAEHMVYNDIDVVFGGGRDRLIGRSDGENLRDTLISRGYQWVETNTAMSSLSSGKAWGLFAKGHMQPDMDRAEFAPTEPSLAEMTSKAIELLSKNEEGFFLMVEGSQVDWAGHNNDPIYMVTDFLAFDEAVRAAVNFAKQNGETMVLAFPDHNTGGMTLGSYFSDKKVAYDRMSPEFLVDPLKGMKLSSQGVAAKISNKSDTAQIRAAVRQWWNIELTDGDINEILTWPYSSSFNYKLASVVSKNYTAIGWTTHGHNGEDVPIWSYGCYFVNTIENTDVAKKIFGTLGTDQVTQSGSQFVNIDEVFGKSRWALDKTDPQNLVCVVTDASKEGFYAKLPVSKDHLYVTRRTNTGIEEVYMNLGNVVVYAPNTDRVYISREAVNTILDCHKKF